jgi:hypothetical protein
MRTDDEHFTFQHASAPYFEFPIMPDGRIYNGDRSPGTDRVVIGSVAADYSSAVFCATLTHTGSQERNGFVECRDDTVNPNGEGQWDESMTKEGGRKGLVPPSGEGQERELLKKEGVRIPWHVPATL